MTFWILSSGIALAVAALLIGALKAARLSNLSAVHSDIAVYKDQLAEVERDLARGILSEAEAGAVRIEVSRRLLEADKRRSDTRPDDAPQSASGIVFVAFVVVAGGLGAYAWLGAPGYGDLPMKARLEALEAARADRPGQVAAEAEARESLPAPPPADAEFLALMADLRSAIAERPNDIEGLGFLAQYEARLGRFAEARAAQEKIVEVKGDNATALDRLTLVDIMVFATAGYISPEAEAVVRDVLSQDAQNGAARYYIGLTEAQAGRADRAFEIWAQLLVDSPANAPWVPVIRTEILDVAFAAGVSNYELPAISGQPALNQSDIDAAQEMTAQERAEMVQGMVGQLADRLAVEGGPPEDWARLIVALGVLGDLPRANAVAIEAESAFSGNPAAIAMIEQARVQAGIAQ